MTSNHSPSAQRKCPNCGGDIAIRNPTGTCDHLYYPENVPKPSTPNQRLEELIAHLEDKEIYGEPCPDYDKDCAQCRHWQSVSSLKALLKLREALEHMKCAWNIEGKNPAYHREWKRKLEKEWNQLHKAIEILQQALFTCDKELSQIYDE